MSAFVVNPTHIATCAAGLSGRSFSSTKTIPPAITEHSHGPGHGERHQRRLPLRSGRPARQPCDFRLDPQPSSPMPAGTPLTRLSPPGISRRERSLLRRRLHGLGLTSDDCRSAEAIPYKQRRGLRVPRLPQLPVVRDRPSWQDNKARMWILESKSVLAGRLARQILGETAAFGKRGSSRTRSRKSP